MSRRSWEIAERLSWPAVLGALALRGAGRRADLIEERVEFGAHLGQYAVVVRPSQPGPPSPLVFFIHGGSWRSGSPERYRAVGRFLARHGHCVALVGYRLAPAHRFPAQRDDVFAGIRAVLERPWADAHSADGVVLAGQSAGAQLAALAALDEESRAASGLEGLRIAGLLAVSGVLDFEALCPTRDDCPLVEGLMGSRTGWSAADPARYVHGGARMPILVLHGSRDPIVPVEVAASFVLRANGAEGDHAVFLADPDAHHADMTRVLLGTSPLTPEMLAWLEDLGPSAGTDSR